MKPRRKNFLKNLFKKARNAAAFRILFFKIKKIKIFVKLGYLNYKKHLAEKNIFMYNILL